MSLSRTRRVRWLWVTSALMLVVSLCGCSQPKPVRYSMGSVIGMGSLEMSVGRTEAFSESNHRALSVHLVVNGIASNEQGMQLALLNHRRFELVDGGNNTYKCLAVMPTDFYYKALAEARGDYRGARGWGDTWGEDSGSAPIPKNWVLLFEVPPDARGFILTIDNAKARSNQPRRISVPLDR